MVPCEAKQPRLPSCSAMQISTRRSAADRRSSLRASIGTFANHAAMMRSLPAVVAGAHDSVDGHLDCAPTLMELPAESAEAEVAGPVRSGPLLQQHERR